MTLTKGLDVESEALRASVREKYREVAIRPDGAFHFHTGRPLAALLGYPPSLVKSLPDRAVESFAVGRPVPAEAVCNVDLWTDCTAGGLSRDGWQQVLRDAGFEALEVGPAVDTFGGAPGEANARRFEVFGHPFLASMPQ